MPEFLFTGGRLYSGRLGSSAVSFMVDTVPKTRTTNMYRRNGGRLLFERGEKLMHSFLAGVPQGEEGPPAVQAEADQQRSVHQAEQGHHQHA